MSSAEAECNLGVVAGMAMSHMCMLHNEINGEKADIICNGDNAIAVTIVNSGKDIRPYAIIKGTYYICVDYDYKANRYINIIDRNVWLQVVEPRILTLIVYKN